MNKEQIIDEVYENWCKQFEVDPNNFNVDELVKGHGDQCWGYPILDHVKPTSKEYKRGQINAYLEGKADRPFFYLSKDEFINKCKTDTEFSERWGLKIEERELSLEERHFLLTKTQLLIPIADDIRNNWVEVLNDKNIPTKLITITYNNKTIESYE
jgi:hypothetical protein